MTSASDLLQTGAPASQYRKSMRVPFDIVGSNQFGRYPKISSEQTFNMIISDGALVDFAGYELVANISTTGVSRALYNSVVANKLVAVINNGLYLIDQFNTATQVGTLNTSVGNCFIADNLASQIAVVDGTQNVYIYNYATSTFQVVPITFNAGYIAYQDTYFIAPDTQSDNWWLSAQSDGTSWPTIAQNNGKIETKPTKAVATVALDRTLLVMGTTVTEPWYDVGAQLFPYQRSNFFAIDYGCINPDTIGVMDNQCTWLASNEKSNITIMTTQEGSQPQRLSNDGMDFVFANLIAPQNCYGFMFRMEGHMFYQITFVTDNITYLYDFNTQKFFSLTDENMNAHIARRVVFFNGNNYFISLIDGNLYKMNSSINTYNGAEIPRIRICSNIRFPDAARFVIQNINLTMESGINQGFNIQSVTDPSNPSITYENVNTGTNRIDISQSTDGGYVYRVVASKKLPTLGRRRNVVNFYNLGGYTNDVVFKFRFNAFGRFVVTGGLASLYR
jgi:hypothetical protein